MRYAAGAIVAALATIAAPALAQSSNVALHKSVTGTGYYDAGTEVFPYTNLTDGRVDDSGTAGNWSFWLTPNGQTGTAVIDLGGLYALSSIYVQNTLNRGYHDREASAVTLYLGTVAPTLGNPATYGPSLGSIGFTNTTAYGGTNSGVITDGTLAVSGTGRYLTVDMTGFYGLSGGLNEVEAFGTAATGAVPEPSTWAMMVLGIGAVGYAMRRRRLTARVRFA